MSTMLRNELGSLHLSPRRDVERLDRERALRRLRAAAASAPGRQAMRRLLADSGGVGVQRLSDDDVLEALAARIEAGQIVAFGERAAGGVWAERIETEPPPPVEAVVAPPVETTWVEIQLVDLAGQPVPNERYRLTLPDGTVKEGRTNYRGRARYNEIETPGACTVEFPDLDRDAWGRA